MKKNFQRFTSLFLVFVTLFNTVISPFTVLADTNTPKKGDLRVVTSSGTTTGDSVSVITGTNPDGSLVKNGDISITKTVSKTDTLGRYKVQFTVKGKNVKNETSTTKDVYVVVVLDKSGSMEGKKWKNAQSGAKTFATSLLKNINDAKIALVTFSGTKNDEEVCENVWVRDNSFIGGHYEKKCTNYLNNDATIIRKFENANFSNVETFGKAEGGTNLGEGLNKALDLFNGENIPSDAFKYVVVLGDGKPTYYTDNEGKTAGPGGEMTTETKEYATTKAQALKNIGAEIFSIGYSVSSNSAAEKVLKTIASTNKDTDEIKHYISANGGDASNVASVFNNIATSISYDFAGKNAIINDGIGSKFTLVSGTNIINVGNITEEGITTEPFYIDIDPDSETGWHATNADFSLDYTKPDGTKGSIKCSDNPEVYWVQNEYDYRIEYYYDEKIDNTLTETGKAVKDAKIEVLDTTINDNTHLKNGYKFVSVNPESKQITIKNNGENVIRVYYEKAEFSYTVEYYYDNEIDNSKTETKSALFESVINNYTDKNEEGYKFDKTYNFPLTITSDNKQNIIKVYYITDGSQRKNINYTVEYYKDGVKQENDTQVITKDIQVLEPKVLDVDKSSINITDKYYGYKFVGSDPNTIPTTIVDGGVIKIYYEKDLDKTKELNYTVKYYKDGVLQEKDTQVITKKVQVLEPNTLEVNKNNINTVNKYDGYKFDKTNPEEIPTLIENNGVIEIYYVKDEFSYTVEYYYDGTIDDNKTETAKALFESVINNYQDKNKTGYKLDKTENLPLTITSDSKKNVIKVYYVKDNYGYKVEYYYDNQLDDSMTYTSSAEYLSQVNDYPDGSKKGFSYISDTAPLTITEKTENNIIKVYYESNVYDYTIYHVEKGNENNILDTVRNSAKYQEEIKVNEKEFIGFTYDSKDKEVIKIDTENNIAYVYYTRNNYDYTIYHVEKGNENNILDTVRDSANYQEEIKVNEKEFTGFTYDSKDTDKIIIDVENNVAYVYYTRNNYDYTIYHVEKGNENNILDTVRDSAKYQEEIKVNEKEFTGFTYESKDKEVIKIDTENNVAYVYYTRNNYDYTIYYVEKGNENNILDTVRDSANYQEEIKVNEKEFTGFTYESKDKEVIKIDTENNIAYVYYTRNNYDYTIYHVEKGNESNILDTVKGRAKYQEEIKVNEKEFTGFTYESKDTDKIIIDVEKNVAYVYYTRNKYNYTVEHYLETKDGKFELEKIEEVENVDFGSNITYKELEFKGYKYDETLTEAPEKVLEDNLVVRLYYILEDSKVTVHYVVKVDDNYISFDKYGRDELGNNTEEFKDVDLLDEILTGKIGTSFTTKYREVKNYNFIGIYKGNILENSNLEKLEGTNITGEFDFEEQEYTYVYEAPRGGDEVPPQTGFDGSLSYLNYILLVAVIYVLKKYFDLISEK